MIKTFTGIAIIGASLTGFSQPALASFDDQYVCESLGDTSFLVIMSSRDPSKASVQLTMSEANGGDSVSYPMEQVIAASGVKYAGVGFIFHSKGGKGILETGAGAVHCNFAGEETDEQAENEALNIEARSYGGKVRAGPGMEFDQIASLREGDAMTLLNNTGVAMNGYDWFFIRLPDGQEGYQWGGLLCSDALHVAGIYGDRDCPSG